MLMGWLYFFCELIAVRVWELYLCKLINLPVTIWWILAGDIDSWVRNKDHCCYHCCLWHWQQHKHHVCTGFSCPQVQRRWLQCSPQVDAVHGLDMWHNQRIWSLSNPFFLNESSLSWGETTSFLKVSLCKHNLRNGPS